MADPVVTGAELATPGIPDPPPRADPPPAVVETASPAPTPPEPVTAAPSVDPPKEVPATVAETPSLLETIKVPGAEEPAKETKTEEPAKVEEKPADKPAEQKAEEKPADAPKVEPEKPPEPEKPAPVEYKYELGDDLVLNDERRGEFHGVLDAYRADPANVQPLIDFHRKAMTDYAQAVSEHQHKVFNDTRAGWNQQIMADEQLGGSGYETTKIAVARTRDMLTSTAPRGSAQYKKDQLAVDEFMRVTGAGDHPVFWKMLHNGSRLILERDSSEVPHDHIQAPKDNGRGPMSRRDLMYNHPTSPNNRKG